MEKIFYISAGFVGGGASIVNAEQKKSQIPAGAGAKVTVTPMTFLVIGGGEVRAVAVDGSAEKKNGLVGAIIEQIKKLKDNKEKKK